MGSLAHDGRHAGAYPGEAGCCEVTFGDDGVAITRVAGSPASRDGTPLASCPQAVPQLRDPRTPVPPRTDVAMLTHPGTVLREE